MLGVLVPNWHETIGSVRLEDFSIKSGRCKANFCIFEGYYIDKTVFIRHKKENKWIIIKK